MNNSYIAFIEINAIEKLTKKKRTNFLDFCLLDLVHVFSDFNSGSKTEKKLERRCYRVGRAFVVVCVTMTCCYISWEVHIRLRHTVWRIAKCNLWHRRWNQPIAFEGENQHWEPNLQKIHNKLIELKNCVCIRTVFFFFILLSLSHKILWFKTITIGCTERNNKGEELVKHSEELVECNGV